MYTSIPKSECRSDLKYFNGGYFLTPGKTHEDYDLPNCVYLSKYDSIKKKFCIRIDLPSKYIEIPLSISQLNEWFSKEDKKAKDLEIFDYLDTKKELEDEKNAAIDIGEYDIGQEEGELNLLGNTPGLIPSTYSHEGECFPSNANCQYCYKYWCSICGTGMSSYLNSCCKQ